MNNLETLGFETLSADDKNELNGGCWCVLIPVGIYLIDNWDSVVEGFNDGLNGQ